MKIKYLLLLLLFFFTISLKAQVNNITACDNDTVYLRLNTYHGHVQWQSSSDSLLWQNITSASDTLSIVSSPALLYRAKVGDGSCDTVISDTSLVSFYPIPTVANAGPDQINLSNVNTTLAGNTAVVGTGSWQIVSGSGGTITSVNTPNSAFKGVGATSYTLVWKIQNECKTTTDTVIISFAMPQVSCNGTLYVHPTDNSGGAIWGCSGTTTGATSLSNGETNTTSIVNACSDNTIAAYKCSNLTAYGYSDWYLPSADELNCLYLNRIAIGGFPTISGIVYWTSTETNAQWANAQNFYTGAQTTINNKTGACRVRCVRRD